MSESAGGQPIQAPAADQAEFPFDITALDWRSYIADIHIPGQANQKFPQVERAVSTVKIDQAFD
jgi:hypothetical protein